MSPVHDDIRHLEDAEAIVYRAHDRGRQEHLQRSDAYPPDHILVRPQLTGVEDAHFHPVAQLSGHPLAELLRGQLVQGVREADVPNADTVFCRYGKPHHTALSLGVSTVTAKGSADDVLKATLLGNPGEAVSGLGVPAAFYRSQATVGQLVAVKAVPGSHFRVVTFTGEPDAKDKFRTLAQKVLSQL